MEPTNKATMEIWIKVDLDKLTITSKNLA